MRIKFKDIELAIDYIKLNSVSEVVTIDTHPDNNAALVLSFIDKSNKASMIYLFDAASNTTPDIKSVSKLYRNKVIPNE